MGSVSEPARRNTRGGGICRGSRETGPHLPEGIKKFMIWREATHQCHWYLTSPAGRLSRQFKFTSRRPSFLPSQPLGALFTETSHGIGISPFRTRGRAPKARVTSPSSMLAAPRREPGPQLAVGNQHQPPPPAVYRVDVGYTATLLL